MSFWDMGDHNYRVDGLPPSIRAKISELIKAAMRDGRETDAVNVCRYNLERTIVTKLNEKDKA